MSRDLADLLLGDMGRALAHLENHPTSSPLTSAEAGGFHH
jgi:glutamate decarboxylase